MPSVTFPELQERVGRKLGIVAAGQTLNATDGAIVAEALLDVDQQLSVLLSSPLSVSDGVENAYADPIVEMAAAKLVDEFGVAEPRRSQIKAQGDLGVPGRSPAERLLRALIDSPTVKLSTTTDVPYV